MGLLSHAEQAIGASVIPDVIGSWDWDIPANRIYTDDVVARLFGVDPDHASTGLPIERYESGIHPEDQGWVGPYIRRTVASSGVFVAEYRTCMHDGAVRWVLARGRFYHDGEGRPLRSHGIVVDITDRKIDGSSYVAEPLAREDHTLERVADHCIAAREAFAEMGEPFLLKLADMLLLEVGRMLARQAKAERIRRMC
ncbi:PAS domain-containing protein [Methylobacterium crusticola]|nr:PAS domain-containing protein [Methylobacterium crusticola]